MTTRSEFEKLAEFNLADAELLLERERFTSAYQLAGFAAECALKAIVVRQFKAEKLPNLFLVEKAYTHDLEQLMDCLLYTSPSPRDRQKSRMPSSA